MRPTNLKTKIFLDSGSSDDTKKALDLLGFLDGQTTNPTLVSKNPIVQQRLAEGKKYSTDELVGLYRTVVSEISYLIPDGSVSIEVYADQESTTSELLEQAQMMNNWIPNAHIKFPTIKAGLEAAHIWTGQGNRANMTLAFTEQQAASVYSATIGSTVGNVFYSSFVGRLFDNGVDGIANLKNIQQLYAKGNGHVQILACSFRNINQFLACLQLGVDIVTVSLPLLQEWVDLGMIVPDNTWKYPIDPSLLQPVYEDLDINQTWQSFDYSSTLTDQGIAKFASDWNNLIG